MERPPIKYLNHVRIQKPKFLLAQPYDKLRDIALEVGYRDEFYQRRAFPKITFDLFLRKEACILRCILTNVFLIH